MLKKIIAILALLPILVHAQYSGPPYNPANVNITGGTIKAGTLQNSVHVFCTNSADDVAINAALVTQNALPTGGTIQVHGTCDITNSILPLSNTILKGDGRGITVLKLHNSTTYGSTTSNIIYALASNSANLSNFGISDMTLDGNRANNGVILYGAGNASAAVTIPYTVTTSSNDTVTYVVDGVSKSATIAGGTYSTLQTLVAALHTAFQAATTNSDAIQQNGFISLYSLSTGPTSTIASISGNGAAGLFGTPTYVTGVTDNAYNGIVIRGNAAGTFTANNFYVRNIESKNQGFHGMAVYDGANEFDISDNHFHHNGFRCVHVHAAAGSGAASTTNYRVTNNYCHDDGQGITMPPTSGTGMFVIFDGTGKALVQGNRIYNEPEVGMDVTANSSGTNNPPEDFIVDSNSVQNTGSGFQFRPGTQAVPLVGITVSNNSSYYSSYNFILGSAASGLTITTGSNDSLVVNIAGVTNTVVIPPATYGSSTALASAISTAINTAYAATGSGVTVTAPATPAGFIKIVPITTNGLINNAFSVSAPGSSSAYAYIFGSAPIQYSGRRAAGNGLCYGMTGNSASTLANFVVTGNRARYCASWGMSITGGTSSLLSTKFSVTGNNVDSAGQDTTATSGGVVFQYMNGFTFAGNSVTNSNVASAAGRQLYLSTNVTGGAITGNYLDTVSTTLGVALETSTTANYNTLTGNMINRQNGTSNQFNNTGTGNIICNNIQGSSNAGTVIGSTPCGTLTATTGSIGGGALLAGACTSGTVSVTNAATTMAVQVSPNTYPGDGVFETAYVSSAGTVTVKVCASIAETPTASTYNVRVIP